MRTQTQLHVEEDMGRVPGERRRLGDELAKKCQRLPRIQQELEKRHEIDFSSQSLEGTNPAHTLTMDN